MLFAALSAFLCYIFEISSFLFEIRALFVVDNCCCLCCCFQPRQQLSDYECSKVSFSGVRIYVGVSI